MPGHGAGTRGRARGFIARRFPAVALVGPVLLGAAGCAGELSALDPAGPSAARVAQLWWIMLGGAVLILGGVMGAALYALKGERGGRNVSDRAMLAGWGLAFPSITLAALLVFALIRGEQLLTAEPDAPLYGVHVRQWDWTFTYPDGRTTTDILHVEAGRDFQLHITSADVIHSFWAPRLGGKIDAIPGKETWIVLRADEPGLYRGLCAEYCGVLHAHMDFEIHAHDPADYAAALDAADTVIPDPLEVLTPRRPPAARLIGQWRDYLLDLVGLR